MREDNTPRYPFLPIGKLVWDGSVVAPLKDAADLTEVIITCVVPQNYALRFTNVSWQMLITDAAANTDLKAWSDVANLTFATSTVNWQISLQKETDSGNYGVTNAFSTANVIPYSGSNWDRLYRDDFATGVIFRMGCFSGNEVAATTIQSQMEALVYTVEQVNQAYIHMVSPSTGSYGTGNN